MTRLMLAVMMGVVAVGCGNPREFRVRETNGQEWNCTGYLPFPLLAHEANPREAVCRMVIQEPRP